MPSLVFGPVESPTVQAAATITHGGALARLSFAVTGAAPRNLREITRGVSVLEPGAHLLSISEPCMGFEACMGSRSVCRIPLRPLR